MDLSAVAIDGFACVSRIFLQDLQALPEEAFTRRFGSATRTVADIVYEVNLVNDHIGMVLRGDEPFPWPEGAWITAPAGFDSRETIIAAFEASSNGIIETLRAFSQDQFEEPVMNDGRETTRFERCRFMTVHLWYHSGQLNFIQTLLGDDAWHWQ